MISVLPRRRRLRLVDAIKYAVLLALTVGIAYPLIWVAVGGLRTTVDLFDHPFSWPSSFHLGTYLNVLSGGFDVNILNSLWICSLSTLAVIVVCALAAYPAARMEWRLRRPMIAYLSFGLLVPVYAALIPLYTMLQGLESQIGPQLTLAVVYMAIGIPIAFVILLGYFSQIPRELEEAALVDGCSTLRLIFRVLMPVAGPGIAVATSFTFIAMWNELLLALVFLTYGNQQTIPLALLQYVGSYQSDWPSELAAITLAVIPTLAIYLVLQRRLMAGVLRDGGIH